MSARSLRWLAGVGLAGIAHVVLFWAVALGPFPDRESERKPHRHTVYEFVQAGQRDSQLVAEQVELFDPRPLLLPTRWNAGSAETIRDFIDEEREIFEDFPPQFRSEDGNFARRYGNRWREMTSVLEAHIEFEASVLDELGRKENPQPAVERRGFAVRVLGLRGGEEIISERLYNSDARGELEEEWPEWRPAHFVVSVEDSFLVRETTVVRSSGSSDADALLAEVALSGELARGTLEDGSYLVKIGL